VMLLTMHHIVSDGWSVGVLIREFTALYEAYRRGEPSPLPELEIQYADYAVWQRQWLQGEALEAQLGYWRKQLAGAPLLDLPTDRPRSVATNHRGADVQFRLSSQVTQQLKDLSRQEGVTLFMTLLAGFQLMLSQYTGQDDVVVGTDVANRNRIETEGLIGFFINQLVLRTDLSGNPSFREILARVRRTVLDAYTYQDVPFDIVVDEVTPDRTADSSPLFQVKLVLQNTPRQELSMPGINISEMSMGNSTSKFDILLNLFDTDEGLVGYNQYDSDLFEASTMHGLLYFYQAALNVVAAGNELADLPKSDLLRVINQQVRRLHTQGIDHKRYLHRTSLTLSLGN
jgi:Condensation domain